MSRSLAVALAGVVWAAGAAAADPDSPEVQAALSRIRPEAIRAHVRFLADDLLEGRMTGTRGYDLAAAYVAAQLEALGLEPAGDGGTFFQQVSFRTARLVPEGARLALVRGGKRRDLDFKKDFVMRGDLLHASAEVDAPVVFVGFGVTAPEWSHDDYAGVDVRGKVVALFRGAPSTFPADPRAYYSSNEVKQANAAARGAVGVLSLRTPSGEARTPWERVARYVGSESFQWLDEKGRPGDAQEGIRASALLSRPAAEALFQGSQRSFAQVAEAAEAGRPQAFPLATSVRMRGRSVHGSARSANVVAVFRGSDPGLASEHVVFSAHLDHLGMAKGREGDSIHNGAFDNASGVAAMLEVARAFSSLERRPHRSVVFLAVTGEERGLLGAEYFAYRPTIQGSIVANVNLDMFLALYPIGDVVAFGAEHTSLGPTVERSARSLGLEVSADPYPEETVFIRSDQYAFVKKGIPAVMIVPGFKSADPKVDGADAQRHWLRTVYHTPQDDLGQAFHEPSWVKGAQIHFLVGYEVAQASPRPAWNAGDFFGRLFGAGAQAGESGGRSTSAPAEAATPNR